MSNHPFEIGQIVRHKASHERGVITAIHRKCSFHKEGHTLSNILRLECVYDGEFDGTYAVSWGRDQEDQHICDYLLEAVPE